MPLVLFVGVNHHWHTVIFACCLLAKEGEEEYRWCMSKFLQCMGGVKPGGILTDQCPSIELGVQHVLAPETVHRYCSWHILHKLPSKWGNVDNKIDLSDKVKAVVYQSDTSTEFDERWINLMNEIGYQDNQWFRGIFEIRQKWVPAYLNDRFWAGMTTTQRVESMNKFMYKYLKLRANLGEFVLNFEKALKRIWEREHEADYESKYKTPKLSSALHMERQLRSIYTNKIFYKCQDEFRDCVNLTCRFRLEKDDSTRIYEVHDISGKIYEVQYKGHLREVVCSCKLFEVSNIVCSHFIEVLKQENQIYIDEKYIVDRWRKDINRIDLKLAASSDLTTAEHNR